MNKEQAGGFLVVLSDVKKEQGEDYFAWLTTEHVQERLGIPGFLGVRVFRKSITGGDRYFIWYRLESADVVDSAAYVDRLNNPTPWSRKIMPILGNFGRGGGSVVASRGDGTGTHMLSINLADAAQGEALLPKADRQIKSMHLLVTDAAKSAVQTKERGLRGSDNSFPALLIIESDSERVLNEALGSLSASAAARSEGTGSGLYREVFALNS